MAEQAKRQAIEDIKAELEKSGKCFLAFRGELDPVMEKLEKKHSLFQFIRSII